MKGIWDLLEASRHLVQDLGLSDLHVTIAGTADTDDTQDRLESFISGFGLSGNVELIGHAEGAAKTGLFAGNGVFVFPSRFENSPITLKEANQAGMVIVASDIDANVRVLDRNDNYVLFRTGDHEGLANAMADLIHDRERFARLKANSVNGIKFDESYAAPILRDLVQMRK
jgi:glycosyltransferase involved in cell wall biosynthesis